MTAPFEVRASGKTVAILSSFFDAVIRAKLEAVRTGAPVDIIEAQRAPVTVLPRGVAPEECAKCEWPLEIARVAR